MIKKSDYQEQPIDEMLLAYLKVLAEPKRMKILDLLMEGVQCNCEIGNNLDMAPNLISHHLGVLRQAGLVTVTRDDRDARWAYYAVNPDAVVELQTILARFFDLKRIKPRQEICGPDSQNAKGA